MAISFRSHSLPSVRFAARFVLSLAALALIAGGCDGQGADAPLRLLDLSGKTVEPLRAGPAKAIVFLFVRTDCPISNRYAPELRRLYEKFTASNVAFWLVYADTDESAEMIGRHLKEYGYRAGVLRDPRHDLVRLTGVRVTPEAAVFASGRLVYRGRIDDRYMAFGKSRPAPTTHDLEEALDAVLKGKAVARQTTTAIGCFIPEL